MTKLEADFELLLESKKRRGEIRDYKYEALTLKLGPDCRYTPDFMVMESDDTIAFYETKGPFARDDGMVKLRVASEQFPFRFFLCKRPRGEDWTITPVG